MSESPDFNEINTMEGAQEYLAATKERLENVIELDVPGILTEQKETAHFVWQFITSQVIGGAQAMQMRPHESAQPAADTLESVQTVLADAFHDAEAAHSKATAALAELVEAMSFVEDMHE